MRRAVWILPSLLFVGLAAALFLRPNRSPARPETEAPATPPIAKAAPALPLTRVVLYSSGVGYFQRDGQVEGDARVELSFPENDINDLLKSMVLQDRSGGQVSVVSYDSRDPAEKTLKSFALDLTENPSLAKILLQARGEEVELSLKRSANGGGDSARGTIVGIETQKEPAGKESVIDVDVVNLSSPDGMRSVRLPEVQRVRFVNRQLDAELQRALRVLAQSHDKQKKSVSVVFTGQGKRDVRVGYVVEHPIWKTSYRLVLSDSRKPFLQGWAVVENPSDEDWNNIHLSLVSGRPISFRMDLYDPLYVSRPVVEPELFASLRPPTYNSRMGGMGGRDEIGADDDKAAGDPRRRGGKLWAKSARQAPQAPSVVAPGRFDPETDSEGLPGVVSAATATALGDYFQYAIDHPVNVARQKSAMLPIVDGDVDGTPVSIYSSETHPKYPMLGLRLRNTTGLHLMQGPITVFQGTSYAGDARTMDLEPNEERLVSYAIDLGTEVDPVAKREPDHLVSVRIRKGIVQATSKLRESVDYRARNRSMHDRTLLIQHPFRPEYHLVGEERPPERARDVYRFELKLPAGKSEERRVVEERDLTQTVVLSNADDHAIDLFLKSNAVSDTVKDALRKALELKQNVEAAQQHVANVQQKLRDITEDQTRLRANLKEMPPTAAAYKRYLDKFDAQETQIDKLQGQLGELRDKTQQQRKALDDYLGGLDIG
jgi:hypothetical protein